jgi:hypothetical protein
MPTFPTPEPISATIDVAVGEVRIVASERDDTVVDVRPTDPSDEDDVRAAQETLVDFARGRLIVRAPKPGLRAWLRPDTGGSVDVTIELPAGSNLNGAGGAADFHCDGRLGALSLKTGLGQIRIDRAETVSLKTGSGDISVERVTGHAQVTTGAGDVRVGGVERTAAITTAKGDTWVGAAGGDLRVKAAAGSIAVDAAEASVGAKSAYGDVRLGQVGRGSVVLETHAGDVEVGIPEGTAAWLEASSAAGRVHNALEAADAPGPSAQTVEVRARTSIGDVVIRRP